MSTSIPTQSMSTTIPSQAKYWNNSNLRNQPALKDLKAEVVKATADGYCGPLAKIEGAVKDVNDILDHYIERGVHWTPIMLCLHLADVNQEFFFHCFSVEKQGE